MINKDLLRSGRNEFLFKKNNIGYVQLKNVLETFCKSNPEIGKY